MYKISVYLLFIIIFSSPVYSAEKIAILPFQNDTGMAERDYRAVYESFRKKVSENSSFELLSHDDTVRSINEVELDKKKISTHLDTIPIGKYLGVSRLIYGNTGIYNQRMYINVILVDIHNQSILNQVSWNIPLSSNPFSFAESSANKLLWQDRTIYPNRADVLTNRKNPNLFNSAYYERDMVKFLSSFNFPRSTEIIEVSTTVKENKDISVYGCLGCATLLGWIVLPFYETKSEITVRIKLRYLDDFNNLKEIVFFRDLKDSENYHMLRKESSSFGITGVIYDKAKNEIRNDILMNSELFIERIR